MNLGKIKKRLRFLGPRSRSKITSSSKVRDIVPFLMGELEALHERNAELQADCNLLREANWVAYREYEILENKHGTLMRKHQKRESDLDNYHHDDDDEDWGSFPSFDSNNSQDFQVTSRVHNLLGVVEEGEDEEGSNSSRSSSVSTRLVRQGSGDSKKGGSQVTETTTTTTRSQDSMATVSTKADSPKNNQHNDDGGLLSEVNVLRRQLYETQLTKDKILIQLAELRSDYVDVTKTLQCSLRNMEVISHLHKKKKRESTQRRQEEESIRSRRLLENQQSAHHEALSSVSAQLEQETNRIGRLREVLWEQMGIHLEDLESNNGEGGAMLMYSEKRHTEALDALRLVHEKEMDRLRKAHRVEMERVTLLTRGLDKTATATPPPPTHRSELLALHTTLDDKDKEIQRLQDELGRALKNLMSLSTELDRLRGLHECCSDDNTYVDDNSFVNHDDHHHHLAESLSFSSLDRTRDIFLQDLHTSMKSLDPQGVSPKNNTNSSSNNSTNNNNKTGHHRHDHQSQDELVVHAPSFESPHSGLSAREGSMNALDTTTTAAAATDQDFMVGGESGGNPASPAPQPSPLGYGCLLNSNNHSNNNKEPTVIHNSTPVISNRVVKSIPTTAAVDKKLSIKPLAEEEEAAAATEEEAAATEEGEEQEEEQDISSMKELVFGPHLTEVHVTPMDDDSDLSVTNRSWSTRDSSEAVLHEVGKDEILGVKQNSMDSEEEEAAAAAAAATGETAVTKTKSTTESLIDYWSSLATTKEEQKNGAALEGTLPPSIDTDLTSSIARRLAQDVGSDDADTINDATHQIQVDLAITEMTLRSMEADLSHFSLSSYPPEMLRTPRNEQGMLLVDTPKGKSSAVMGHHHHNNNNNNNKQQIDFSDDAEPTSSEILKRVVSLTRSPTRGRNRGQQLRNGTKRPMAQLPNALPRNLLLQQHRKALDAIIFEDASASDSSGSNQSSYKTTHSTENVEGSDPSALIGRTFFAV